MTYIIYNVYVTYIYVYMLIYMYIYLCINIYVCMYVCEYVCMYINIYNIYIYKYIHMIIQQYVTVHHMPKYCHKAIAVKTGRRELPHQISQLFFQNTKGKYARKKLSL